MIEEELLDYARIDLCIVGGLTEARKIANWCETHYIKIVPTIHWAPCRLPHAYMLHLACDNFAVQEAGLVGDPVMEDLFPLQVPYENGYLLPPQSPAWELNLTKRWRKRATDFSGKTVHSFVEKTDHSPIGKPHLDAYSNLSKQVLCLIKNS